MNNIGKFADANYFIITCGANLKHRFPFQIIISRKRNFLYYSFFILRYSLFIS